MQCVLDLLDRTEGGAPGAPRAVECEDLLGDRGRERGRAVEVGVGVSGRFGSENVRLILGNVGSVKSSYRELEREEAHL